MKKLFILFVALVVVLTLAACSNNETTAPESSSDAASSGTSGAPAESSTKPTETEPPVTTSEPEVTTARPFDPLHNPEGGINILFNDDPDYNAITGFWKDGYPAAFEEHAVLDFRVALVFHMEFSEAGVYEDLVYTTDPGASDNQSNWEMNPEYRWVVTIDGQDIEITNFSLLNDQDSGYIRMDLGNWTYSTEVDELGAHEYDLVLRIYGEDGKIKYFAWFTDPEYGGAYYFMAPEKLDVVPDEKVPAGLNRIDNKTKVEPLFGPDSMANETYPMIFDGDVRSKLCTNDTENAIVARFTERMSLAGISFVGANDDEKFPERVITQWNIYVSDDGESWTLVQEGSDDAPSTGNYQERFYAFDESVECTYVKIEPVVSAMYQLSEVIFYTDAN